MTVGIVGYGAYVPRHYLPVAEIGGQAGLFLGLDKKSLACWDEDSVTMAVEAGKRALIMADLKARDLGAVYVGSESPPYAVNPMSTIVADILGVNSEYRAVDLQFACKAATAGLQMAMGEVAGEHHDLALVIGADKAQARPGDVLEWGAGAAAAAIVVGKKNILARVLGSVSVSSDTPDFWRRQGQQYPSHAGRFTGEPSYFKHVLAASEKMIGKSKFKPSDFKYAVFHMPNGRFPEEVAKKIGFVPKQYEQFLTVKEVGNPYSASALLGLVAALEVLNPGEKVLVTAYGSGAGADSMVIEGTENLRKTRTLGLTDMFENRVKVDKLTYLTRSLWE